MRLELARALADAVLLEGYALYPYRASAPKNRYRWTFGVLAPRAWSEAGGCEPWWLEAQILVAGAPSRIAGQLRFFQIERRRVEDESSREVSALDVGGQLAVGWDEGIVHTIDFEISAAEHVVPFAIAAMSNVEAHPGGRIVRDRCAVSGCVRLRREPVPGERALSRITIRVENTTPWADASASREQAITGAFASTHVVVGVAGGALVSAIDPPPWARTAAAACTNVRTYPVLVGPAGSCDVMLSAPFVLYDYAQLAPESDGDFCDATEIDELLMLRTRTLTDEEKRHARATDPRAAAIVDRSECAAVDTVARMHGATRDLHAGEMVPRPRQLSAGSKVRIRPSNRRSDAQDLLYAGHVATVIHVRHDVDGTTFLAVTIDDDPAAELHEWYGRYHYYRTDEVEPV